MWSCGRVVVLSRGRGVWYSRIAKLLRANPSFPAELPDLLPATADDAGFRTMRETGLPQATFPATCPFILAEVLGEGWLLG